MPLPPGLLLNPATGELTGVPTVPGTYAIALKVRDASGTSRELTDEVVINDYTLMSWEGDLGALMVTRAPIANTLGLNDGLGPYTFSIFSGALPTGLSLDAGTGAITGAPADTDSYAFVLRATDSIGQTCDIVIAGTPVDNLTSSYSTDGKMTVGWPFSAVATYAGGQLPITFAVFGAALPAGLALDGPFVTGTPTTAGSGTVTIRASDAHGYTTDATISYDIAAALAITGALSRGMVGAAVSTTFTRTGGQTPFTWSATGLPPGLSINASTGAVTGTPTTAGSYTGSVTITDTLGANTSKAVSATIAAALAISGSYPAAITRGNSYFFRPNASGGWPGYAYDLSAGSLPTGLSLNAGTGEISGTATAQGTFNATLRVTDADGHTATMAVNITVAGDLSLTGSVNASATVGVAYTGDTLGQSGGTAPYTWSIAAGALPPGVTLNTGTGDLSGTPTTAGSYAFTVRVTDANTSFAQSAFTVTVADPPLLTGDLPDASNGVAYSASYTRTGGWTPYTYAVASGALPTGLSLNTTTGVVSGTPTVNGAATFTIRVTDNLSNTFTHASDTITVYAAPGLSGTLTNHAELTAAYSSSITATGGKPSLAWSVQGTLPPGLTLNASTGAISGTPTNAASYDFNVVVTDALGRSIASSQTIAVASAVALTAGYAPQGTVGQPYVNVAPVVTGGWSAYGYTATGSIPPGVSLNASTGVMSGTLTTPGGYGYTVRVTDSLGVSATRSVLPVIIAAISLSGTAGKGTVGVGYSFTPTRNSGFGPFSYTKVSGSLPPGLSLNSSTGVISGTPTTAGTYTPTISVVDTNVYGGSSDTLALSIVVAAKPTLSLSYPNGEVSDSYSGTASVSGGHSPFTYTKVSGTMPPGLSLNASTGAVTGTPTTAGGYNFWVRVTDAMGNTDDASASVTIANRVAISGSFAATGKVGTAYSSTISRTGGWSPFTFAKASGTLPTGLSVSSAGALTGTPSATGTFNFVMQVTDVLGVVATKSMSIVISAASAALNVTASPNPSSNSVDGTGTLTVSTSTTATATGGSGSGYTYAWTLVSGSGDTPAFTASGTSSRTLTVSATHGSVLGYDRTETWRCTVHDSLGATDTVDVDLSLSITASGIQ